MIQQLLNRCPDPAQMCPSLAAASSWLPGQQIASAAVLLLLGLVAEGAIAAAQQPAPVVVAPAEERVISGTGTFVATITPSRRASIGSAVSGRVDERLAEEGDRVTAGQPLVQILTNTIELELKAAQSELRLRQHELTELKNGMRPAEIEQVQARMLAAQASVELARTQLDRLKNLMQANAIPQGELDQAQGTYDRALQNLTDLKAAYTLAVEGTRKEKLDQAEAIVARQEAEVEKIQDQIRKYTLASRFDGYVTAKHVEVGDWVTTGDPVMDVVALDEVELRANVTEQYVPFIQSGREVPVLVPALPGQKFKGTVQAVIPQADLQARTFPVIVRVPNLLQDGQPVLKSGMVARVELPTTSETKAILVPKDALVLGGASPLVYVLASGPEGTIAKPVPVQPGIAQGDWIQVIGELQPGQEVVVEGNERLRPGQTVEPVRRKVEDQ